MPAKRSWRTVFACWRGFVFVGKYNGEAFKAYLAMDAPAFARGSIRSGAPERAKAIPGQARHLQSAARRRLPGLAAHRHPRTCLPVVLEHQPARCQGGRRCHRDPTARREAELGPGLLLHDAASTALHDIFHVIGGYGPDMAGEVTSIGFHCGQLESAGVMEKLGYLMACAVPGAPLRHKLRVYRQAIERGRCADKMWAAPWEELLDKPIDEVRELLGIASKQKAHPGGG